MRFHRPVLANLYLHPDLNNQIRSHLGCGAGLDDGFLELMCREPLPLGPHRGDLGIGGGPPGREGGGQLQTGRGRGVDGEDIGMAKLGALKLAWEAFEKQLHVQIEDMSPRHCVRYICNTDYII